MAVVEYCCTLKLDTEINGDQTWLQKGMRMMAQLTDSTLCGISEESRFWSKDIHDTKDMESSVVILDAPAQSQSRL